MLMFTITLIGVTITLIGVIVAIIALGHQRNQAETARRREVGVAEWMRDLRDWASEAVEILSETVYASDGTQGSVPGDARRYFPQLSALIDRGRFFLPNQAPKEHGKQKPPAYRGYRHAALDPLVSALIVIEGSVEGKELHEYKGLHDYDYVARNRRAILRELQEEFVSHIQQILDPEGHNLKIASIIKDSQAQAKIDPW